MLTWVVLWTIAAIVASLTTFFRDNRGAGLILGYIVNFSMYHWFASILYLDGGTVRHSTDVIFEGFRLSAIGMICFTLGATLLAGLLLSRPNPPQTFRTVPHRALPATYLTLGYALGFLLYTSLGGIATLQALSAVGGSMASVAICLYLWIFVRKRQWGRVALVVLFVLATPVFTIATSGYIGFGLGSVVLTGSFLLSWFRPRWTLVVAGLLIGFVAMSSFVTYMRDRDDIREVVWNDETVAERFGVVGESFGDWEWFDLGNPAHRKHVDDRLNQNRLVGAAIHNLSITREYLDGRSIGEAALALIPRAIWPAKPVYAGSGDLVSEATGISFDEQTSVGVGHVLEFYINFGTVGVVLGFLLLGLVVRLIDARAGRCLREGDWQGFALAMAVGLPFLIVGGSLVALTASVGASALMMTAVNKLFLYRLQRGAALRKDEPAPLPL